MNWVALLIYWGYSWDWHCLSAWLSWKPAKVKVFCCSCIFVGSAATGVYCTSSLQSSHLSWWKVISKELRRVLLLQTCRRLVWLVVFFVVVCFDCSSSRTNKANVKPSAISEYRPESSWFRPWKVSFCSPFFSKQDTEWSLYSCAILMTAEQFSPTALQLGRCTIP